jgi:hypothetical protein
MLGAETDEIFGSPFYGVIVHQVNIPLICHSHTLFLIARVVLNQIYQIAQIRTTEKRMPPVLEIIWNRNLWFFRN